MLYDSGMQLRWILVSFLLAPLLAEDNLKFGQPACAEPVLDKTFFVVCYDPAHKIPSWVGYALTKADALNKATSRTGSFRADAGLPRGERAENADYAGSGYDQGHMAPANDFTQRRGDEGHVRPNERRASETRRQRRQVGSTGKGRA